MFARETLLEIIKESKIFWLNRFVIYSVNQCQILRLKEINIGEDFCEQNIIGIVHELC